ncbi:MAG: polyribonucleotide nucleotidyltransferase [Flexistipes sinusarabici]|uniref:Polyribonucleotide nucleotidyltransferase n=1 Tax=Flexistipes sinusarabici TaxID=2352 RepID=A0A5D0MMX1_FLESI|nr:polyribonucleotide nucleotidyltransferase [Flexistipes sinusarabici]TYB33742.1 MAG: polyribonucleotide nucleotidyltransferase [Flexistipes sinusarabici]
MENKEKIYEIVLGEDSEPIYLKTGWKAKQANASIWAQHGDTIALVTATCSNKAPEGIDFFPLTVNYFEKFYAVGKIPGGFFKREAKPSDRETLISRLIDRPLRPLFPDGFRNETQIVAMVVSSDQVCSSDILALNAASASLMISDIPFNGPVGAVRVGRIDGELVLNPNAGKLDELEMNITVAGTEDAIVMVEAGMDMVSEDEVIDALEFGHEGIKKIITVQKQMKDDLGKEKISFTDFSTPEDLVEKVNSEIGDKLKKAVMIPGKQEKYDAIDEIKEEYLEKVKEELGEEEFADKSKLYNDAFSAVEKNVFRDVTLNSGQRVDGRKYNEIRPIDIETGLLPKAHGSALFTRGETQALVTTTLGTKMDSQMVDDIEGETSKRFMLHYNFPPYCVGEVGFMKPPGRREIGHGALAERALQYVLPDEESFPYTMRIVSDILESNGSSSMASVCGGSLALMDAGVPVKDAVAGIAMGLIYEKGEFAVLTDIMGLEDHLGDMDFKVTGTKDGITALQMDIKIEGLSRDILKEALEQAKEGRLYILDKMNEQLPSPKELPDNAPRFERINVNPEKVGLIIGPSGKTIKGIIDETGVAIDILDGGILNIFATDKESIENAREKIEALVQELEVNKVYTGKVKKVMEYGAFVELLPGVEALLHVSQYSNERIKSIADYLKVGDEVKVKYLGKDERGRHKITRKDLE